MRKSLWMIPVVLLLTAQGSTAAHADTYLCGASACSSGGYVTEIEDIEIGPGNTLFNVTFEASDNNPYPFNTSADAQNAGLRVALSLGPYSIGSSSSVNDLELYFCVDSGLGTCELFDDVIGNTFYPTWQDRGQVADEEVAFTNTSETAGYWAVFSPSAVATPEPGTTTLTLTGLGLLGLLVVMRKRVAHRHPQAT